MSHTRLINDINTSPLLKTIYTPLRDYGPGEAEDNTVFIAVNDQPSATKDTFGNDVSKCGHVKFMTAAQVNMAGTGPDDMMVSSYLIQHSLPQFPAIPLPKGFATMSKAEKQRLGPIYGTKLPPPGQIFESNLNKNGQHFMCMSFKDAQKAHTTYEPMTGRQWIELDYDKNLIPTYLSSEGYHFAKILHYLKVTHAAVVGTNYNPFNLQHAIYHRYLNVFKSWNNAEDYRMTNNMSRLLEHVGNFDSDHLCPMWPLYKRVRLNHYGQPYKLADANKFPMTMRSSSDAKSSVCQIWNPAAPSHLCLASAKLKTTNTQYELIGLMLMKNKKVPLAPFDDMISPLVVPLDDYTTAAAIEKTTAEKKNMSLSLKVQSWIDFATLPEDTRQLMPDDSPLQITLNIINSQGITVPSQDHVMGYFMKATKDHSKWAMAFPKAMTGTFAKLYCISDLNRTLKHMDDPGRGGSSSCFSHGPFTELFLSLQPSVEHTKAASKYSQIQHLYQNFDQALSSTIRYTDCMRAVYISDHRKPNEMSILCCTNPFWRQTPVRSVALPAFNSKLMTPYGPTGPASDDFCNVYGDFTFVDFSQINDATVTVDPISPFKAGQQTKVTETLTVQQTKLRINPSYWVKFQHIYQAGKSALTEATIKCLRFYLKLDVEPAHAIAGSNVDGLTEAMANVKINDPQDKK